MARVHSFDHVVEIDLDVDLDLDVDNSNIENEQLRQFLSITTHFV